MPWRVLLLVYWQGWRDALRRRGGPPWLGGWGWMTGREEGVTYLRSVCERVAAMRVIAPSNFWERSRRRTRDDYHRLRVMPHGREGSKVPHDK